MTDDGHAHDHPMVDVGSHDGSGHEHPDAWMERPLLRERATAAIDELINQDFIGHVVDHDDTRQSEAETVLSHLDRIRLTHDKLGRLVTLARRALGDDQRAHRQAQRLLSQLQEEAAGAGGQPDHQHGPHVGHDHVHHDAEALAGHDLPHRDHDSIGDNSLAHLDDDLMLGSTWVHPTAVLDTAIAVAFLERTGDLHVALHAAKQWVTDIARTATVTMEALSQLDGRFSGIERLEALIERLQGVRTFEIARLDIDTCVGELFDALNRPKGDLAQASQVSEQEIDVPNTERIASVSPDPVCTGDRLTLHAKQGQSFVEASDSIVAFSPCGAPGTDATWSPERIEVTVPSDAISGPVYLAHRPAPKPELPTSGPNDIAAVIGGCPFFARGVSSSMMVAALAQPLLHARCFVPLSVGVSARILKSPSIGLFRALTSEGSPVADDNVPGPGDQVTLVWEASADSSATPEVRLLAGGTLIDRGLPLRGRRDVTVAETTRYTLIISTSCGEARQDFVVTVGRVLRFDPPDITVDPIYNAKLTLVVDRPPSTDLPVYLTSVPAHPTAPGVVFIPANDTQVEVTFPNVQPALRPQEAATLSVGAYAPACEPAFARVWVNQPLGTCEVVASRTGSQGSQIDVVGVHAGLHSNGQVLLFEYDEAPDEYWRVNTGKSALWDPSTGSVRSLPMSRNLFCAGHAFLGDGRLLVAGGQSRAIIEGLTIASWFGLTRGADHDIHIFDGTWTRVLPDMKFARWYPTCTTLPDGRVLIISGFSAHAHSTINRDYEIFDGATDTLSASKSFTDESTFDLYPFVQVLPGRQLFVHSRDTSWLVSLDESNEPTAGIFGSTPHYMMGSLTTRTYPGQGACVLLPVDAERPHRVRILIVGGGGAPDGGLDELTPAVNTAEIFDYDSARGPDAQTGWRFTKSGNGQTTLNNERVMSDAVLLPDGTVAIVGGVGVGRADHASSPVMQIESFDPATETFTGRTSLKVPRMYHSTALLLPDGSVMVAGSTGPIWNYKASGGSANEFRIEIYYPPYMFRGPRPRAIPSSTALTYGSTLRVDAPTGGTAIDQVVLIRHGSTTHTNNMDQRCIRLAIAERRSSYVDVALPDDGILAPPGPYLLFGVGHDAKGAPVPSSGTTVLLGP